MDTCSRRHFLKVSITGAGLTIAAPRLVYAEKPTVRLSGADLVPLGKTGIKATRLAQGTGYNGWNHVSDHTRLGKEGFARLLRHSLEQGIRFVDMADQYGSHEFARDTIKAMRREELVLLTKLWPDKEMRAAPSGRAQQEVERFCKELGVERLDICLIHAVDSAKWPTQHERILDELSDLKQKGLVRAVGVSSHDLFAMRVAAKHPWVDVLLAGINYKGGVAYRCAASLANVTEVLKTARANGKATLGMKIFGGGRLTKPEEKDASLNYVFANGLVDAMTVGMLKPEEVDDTLRRIGQVAA